MRKPTLIVSSVDHKRLSDLIAAARRLKSAPADILNSLEAELAKAIVLPSPEMPNDVVAMNSKVWYRDLDTGEIESYTLVLPTEADLSEYRISVLAPIGTALLGYRLRDTIVWEVPGGTRRIQIVKVGQPEEADAALT